MFTTPVGPRLAGPRTAPPGARHAVPVSPRDGGRPPKTRRLAALLALGAAAILAAPGASRADFSLSFFGEADSVGAVNSNSYIVLRSKRVAANTVVKFEFTSGGTVITNKDGSHFGFQGQNTANVAADSEETLVKFMGKAVRSFNGQEITDIETTVGGKLASNTDAGFFDPEGGRVGEPRHGSGVGRLQQQPAGLPGLHLGPRPGQPPPLYIGVDLQKWVAGGGAVADGDVGSLYQVTDGAVTALLSGTGPDAAALAGFFFSSTPLSASSTSFTGTPFTGEVEIGSISEVGLGVPEPGSFALLGVGALGLLGRARRRRRR